MQTPWISAAGNHEIESQLEYDPSVPSTSGNAGPVDVSLSLGNTPHLPAEFPPLERPPSPPPPPPPPPLSPLLCRAATGILGNAGPVHVKNVSWHFSLSGNQT